MKSGERMTVDESDIVSLPARGYCRFKTMYTEVLVCRISEGMEQLSNFPSVYLVIFRSVF